MTNEEAVSMIEAKLECLTRRTTGSDIMCNARDCDNCELNYAQGNIGEQKEWLKLAITALHNQEQKTAHWIDRSDEGMVWNPLWNRYICSNCGRHSGLENYCCNCGASMEDEE